MLQRPLERREDRFLVFALNSDAVVANSDRPIVLYDMQRADIDNGFYPQTLFLHQINWQIIWASYKSLWVIRFSSIDVS